MTTEIRRFALAVVVALTLGAIGFLVGRADVDRPVAIRPISVPFGPKYDTGVNLAGQGVSARVAIQKGAFEVPVRVVLDEGAPAEGPLPPSRGGSPNTRIEIVSSYYQLSAANSAEGTSINRMRLPARIVVSLPSGSGRIPDDELIVCYYETSLDQQGWKPVWRADLESTLGTGDIDGFRIIRRSEGRFVEIVTRRLGTYSVFRERKA